MNSRISTTARVTAVASGKGGVGKTNVSVNLATALAAMGRKTMLVDGDVGLANANILLGLNAPTTIADLITRNACMKDVVIEGPSGLCVVPGHSGSGVSLAMPASDRRRLADAFRPYADRLDHIVVDTASGIHAETLELVADSDTVLLVLNDEPTAFMDAYAMVKVLASDHGCAEIAIVTNMVASDHSGRELFRHFKEVVRRFLRVDLVHLGSVPRDNHVREAVFRKRCLVEAFPGARASVAFNKLARRFVDRVTPPTIGGHRFFGMEEALSGAC